MIPEEILCRLQQDKEYKGTLKKFCETPVDDQERSMLEEDHSRMRDTWNKLAGKQL
jgi:hypothetical protein